MTSQTTLSAAAFIDSIGVNTHTAYSWGAYTNASLVIDDLRYLGVTTVRDSFATDPGAAPVMNALAAAGVQFDFLVSSDLPATGTAGLNQYIASIDQFLEDHPGSVVALEGLNEANIQSFSYQGSSSLSAAAHFQAAFYTAIKSNADLGGVSVYNMTLAYNDANGYAALGNLANYTDYSNAHAYVATSTPNYYGLDVSLDTAATSAVGKPSVITETGYTTLATAPGLGVNQAVQAKSILNLLVDSFKEGVAKTYLYELLDRDSNPANSDAEAHFGLFNSDGTPKLAATAIHNLTSILADEGTGGHQPTASLGYSLSNMPSTGSSMVLGKSNGAYDLIVWNEPKLWNDATDSVISNPSHSVKVHLDSVHKSVVIYDPLLGTTPIAVYSNVQDFTIPISDHPLVVEIDAPSIVPTPTPGATEISGTAAEIVSQLSDLNADGAVQKITLTDTHVLSVASEATMKYIIAHYGSVLSAIDGGYSFAVTVDGSNWKLTTRYDAAGHQTATDETAYVDGVIAYNLVKNSDGSTASTNYSHGVATQTIVNYADHSQDRYVYGITGKPYVTEVSHLDPSGKLTSLTRIGADGTSIVDNYDASGRLTSETVTHPDGSSSTSVYAAGIKTYAFVTNADGTHDNYAYAIKGQTYTSQHQHVDVSGKVTEVNRYHANGSLDYKETTAADGTVTSTQYDAGGIKIAQSIAHTNGTKDYFSYNIKGQSYTTEHSSHDVAGNLSLFERFHADGTYALKVTTSNGVTVTTQFDSKGAITSEVVTYADSSSKTSSYAAGIVKQTSFSNVDDTRDVYDHDIVGKAYASEHKHYDASGKVVAITQRHADGTLHYTQVTEADGTRTGARYDASGVKSTESVVHADGSQDIYTFNIKGQTYATEHSVYDASGRTTTFERLRADGSELLKVSKTSDGTSITDQYDASGHLTSETVTHADGSSAVSTYSLGVLAKTVVTNADHSKDFYSYGIVGQTYSNQVQHVDPSGKVTSVVRTHSDGTLDFTQTFAADGSTNSFHFDSHGNATSQVQVSPDGARDVFNFNFGSTGTTQHVSLNASGSVLQTDPVKSDGTHNVTAFKPGQTLSGGAGDDHFVFSTAATTMIFDHGNDRILNFHAGDGAGHDTISLLSSLVADYSQLQIEQIGHDTLIHVNSTNSILLSHVTAAQLVPDNFFFV